MMAFGRRNDAPEHGSATSRRIERRLPDDMPQDYDPPVSPANVWDIMAEEDAPQLGNGGGRPPKQKKYKPPKDKGPKRSRPRRILRALVALFLALLVVVGVSLGVFLKHATRNDDLWLDLGTIQYRGSTLLLYTDAEGQTQEYAVLNATQEKEYVSSGDIPDILKYAFVAIEDKGFYDHGGVDIKRTVFATVSEVWYRVTGSYINGLKQGGSTITQQLIKNLTRDDDATGMEGYLRKIKEIWRAWQMEGEFGKDEILTAYLNTISFTGNTAGVQAEAKKLFGKEVSELTIAECASLAAITRSPGRYNPHWNPETHVERRNYVLDLMCEQGYITEAERDEAKAQPLELMPEQPVTYEEPMTSYFTDTVMQQVGEELQAQRGLTNAQVENLLYNGGLRIHTTVDPALQTEMEAVMSGYGIFTDREAQAAMISLDYEGGIRAVVGGLGEKEVRRGLNRAVNSPTYYGRQTGSTMKGIGAYALALEKGKITWSTTFHDSAVMQVEDEESGEKQDWPRNVTNYYTDKDMLVVDAFAQSVNTIAVRVGETVGWRSLYNFMVKDIGITTLVKDDIDPGPLVLGSMTQGVTPMEMAMAYMMFGNGGVVYTPHSFTHVENGIGETLLDMPVSSKQVVSGETATIMNRLMSRVMTGNGSASGLRVNGDMDSVGKTGTTTDYWDQWFIGLTPYYCTAVWYGYDIPQALNNANYAPAQAWKRVMERAQVGLSYREFPMSDGVVEVAYCTVSGYAAGGNCPSAIGYYREGDEPRNGCPVHG